MLHVGAICLRLNDLKLLVAYSSVSHMAFGLCGFFVFMFNGCIGVYIILLAHGFVSSGMFCLINMYYERLGRRRIYLNKGLINILPLYTILSFILVCANISAPPSINLLSEIMLIRGLESY
jgi:NADH-ubiquinone oxidoreductase chain 4